MHMMRQFLRDSYSKDNTGEQETLQQDDEEDYNFLNSIIIESRFMKFVLLFADLSKKYIICQKNSKIFQKINLTELI